MTKSNFVFLIVGVILGMGIFWVIQSVSPEPDAPIETATPWNLKSIESDLPADEVEAEKISYGYRLITNTAHEIGPLATVNGKQYAGNNLTCNNCHLEGGRKIGSGSFFGVANRFPQFRGRENKMGTLEERINGCMERSMNGRVLPEDGEEMQAMIAYMEWLSEGVPEDMDRKYIGYVSIEIPAEKADTVAGRALYAQHCEVCHQSEGGGLAIPGAEFTGYIYPPLAGDDTYNNGAGMTRVITAAQFIKANMPFGATYDRPLLTDEQAYHIAAYISSLERPTKSNTEADFPDRKLKPVSTPYGPWADSFPPEQHKYGPFQPIMEFYKEEYGLNKTR